jgi:hypothetical protein
VILLGDYLFSLDTMALTDRADRADVATMRVRQPGAVLAFITLFLAGQAALWFMFAVKRRNASGSVSRGRITLAGAMIAIVVVSLLLAMVAIPARWVLLTNVP